MFVFNFFINKSAVFFKTSSLNKSLWYISNKNFDLTILGLYSLEA